MSSVHLAFSSSGHRSLCQLSPGERGIIMHIDVSDDDRRNRLIALGVTPGAAVEVLQTFPGIVFLCDQTELAVERGVAAAIVVRHDQ